MAEKKITELPIIEIPSASALIPIVVDGNSIAVTNAISASALASYIGTQLTYVNPNTSNNFAASQTFNGAVFLNGIVTVAGLISAPTLNSIYQSTSSLNSFTSSIRGEVSGLEAYTQSLKSTGLISGAAQITALGFASSAGADTSQLNIFSGSVNTFTSSVRGEVSGIEAYTASLKGTTIVSSSTQISNYGIFATTSSNTFFGVEGITGSLLIDGTTLDIETGDFVIKAESSVDIKIIPNGDKNFLFGTDGILTLPLGGDVKVESGNTLVLHSVDNLNTYTGSNNNVIEKVLQATSSIHFTTQSLNTQTGSQNLVNLGISIVTGSLNTYTSSNESWKDGIGGEVSGLEAYTASLKGAIEVSGQNVNVLGMITAQQFNVTYVSSSTMYQSGSTKFGNTTDDKHEFTGSVDVTGGITGSLMATNNVVSSSTQIQNYNLFAETSSANTFYGTQTIVNPSVSNTELDGAYVTIRTATNTTGLPIGYRLINTGGSEQSILTMDPSDGTTSLIALTGTLKLRSNTGRVEMTGSVDVTGGITCSLMATNNVVSSSTQISNYYKFAETASANTFYGNQTISGSFLVSGSTIQIGNNTLTGNTILSGSTNISGSTTFTGVHTLSGSNTIVGNTIMTGTNTIIGNTEMSGSIDVSGSSNFHNSIFIVTGSQFYTGSSDFKGNQTITGSLNVTGNINVDSGSGFYYYGNKLFNRGQFYHTATLSGSANTAYPFQYNTTDTSVTNGTVYVDNDSRIYVKHSGIYNVQFSAQLHITSNEAVDFSVWFAMTGSYIDDSNTDYSIEKVGGGGYAVAALNYLTHIQSGSYIELYYSKTKANGQIQAKGTQSTPDRPATPSVILTVTQVA